MFNQNSSSLIELSKENAEILEDTGKYWAIWRKYKNKNIVIPLFLFILNLALLLYIAHGGVIDHPVRIFLNISIVQLNNLLFILFSVGLLFSSIYLFGALITFFSKVPKAGKSPEETIYQFYMTLMGFISMKGKPDAYTWLYSFVCLLEQAKQQMGDYDGFANYWEKIADNIIKNLSIFVSDIKCNIENISEINNDKGIITYEITIKIDKRQKIDEYNISRPIPLGTDYLLEKVSLVNIENRYYLTSPYWNGKIISSISNKG